MPGANFTFQPNEPLSDQLARLLRAEQKELFNVAVAWARLNGVEKIAGGLEEYDGRSNVVVGLNSKHTTYESLFALLDRTSRLFVFYKHKRQTFHPKVYFSGPSPSSLPAEDASAVLFTGSSNLTAGGLETNFEASTRTTLDLDDPDSRAIYDEVIDYFGKLYVSEYCHEVTSTQYLEDLLEGGYISLESDLRASTNADTASHQTRQVSQEQSGAHLPEAPPSLPSDRGSRIQVPPPDVDSPEVNTATDDQEAQEWGAHSDAEFYVRTMTANDVDKALSTGPGTGTWEPDMGITARDEHPDFWGWPHRYDQKPQDSGEIFMEWYAQTVHYSRICPEGYQDDVRLWFRPEREEHAAEHRTRFKTSVKRNVVPEEIDTNSLVVFHRLVGEGIGVHFRVDFILPDDPEYDSYRSYLTDERPEHQYGYGRRSDTDPD